MIIQKQAGGEIKKILSGTSIMRKPGGLMLLIKTRGSEQK